LSVGVDTSEIDFTVEKEDWNIYELDDGTILKIRPVLLRLLKTEAPPGFGKGKSFGVMAQNLVVVTATPDKKGRPSMGPNPPEVMDKAPKINVAFNEKKWIWNTYLLPDNIRLKIRLVVTSVLRAEGLFDQFGNPVYRVSSDNVTARETIS
jgi:hypothetical protein